MHRSIHAFSLIVLIGAACSSAPSGPPRPHVAPVTVATEPTRDAGLATPVVAPPEPPAVKPTKPSSSIKPEDTAGLYWVPYRTCYDCEEPRALVAYVTPQEGIARKIVKALQGKLRLGLPYVVHTDEINASPRGIAVVIGSYSSVAAANDALRDAVVLAGRKPAVVEIGEDPYPTAESPRAVTVIDRGTAVPAWSKRDVMDVMKAFEALGGPDLPPTLQEEHALLLRMLGARKPTCMVNPGDLFVVEGSEEIHYQLAPVRCGKNLAYVSWTSSLLGHAVIVPHGTGHRLYQVVGAVCDAPIIDSWDYTAAGRTRRDVPIKTAGC